MEIKDVQSNQGKVDIVAFVVSKESPKTFEKFGKQGKLCNVKLKDDSGEIKLTLWNDDVDSVNIGDKIHLENGWCSEYKGEKQLSSGKFGKIEVLASKPQEVLTNDPEMLARQKGGNFGNPDEDGDDSDDQDGDDPELFDEEEIVE